jgi:two-component system cell cycle sensor histidine kinase/response regulator CckA
MRDLRVLIVEDNVDDADLLLRQLKKAEFEVDYKRVETAAEVRAALAEEWDVILSDYGMRDFNGLAALEIVQEMGVDIPFIIVSGSIGEETAASLMRHGVNDYLMKDNMNRLVPAIQREMHEAENRREKREAEAALRQSEQRLKLALSAAGLGAWERDLVTNDVFWSPETSALLGVTVGGARIEGLHWQILEEDRPHVQAQYDEAIKTRSPVTVRFRVRRRGGEVIWVSESAQCEYADDGTPLRLVGTIRDITRDKVAQDALVEAEERYRVIAETASDAVISIDETSTILYANPATEAVFGYQPDEVIGRSLTMLMPEAQQKGHLAGIRRFIETGRKRVNWRRTETFGKRKDGTEIDIQISFGHHRSGDHHYFTGFIRDVTESKAAEAAIRNSESNFRALVEATTQFVWQLDERSNLTEYPHWWEELTGQEFEASRNYGWVEYLHPDDQDRVKASYISALQNTERVALELRIKGKDREYRHYSASGVPLPTEKGTRWICSLSDITAQRVAEERYRLVSNVATDYMFSATVDRQGNLKQDFVAGAFEQITGYDVESFVRAGGWQKIVHPDDQQQDIEDMQTLAVNQPVESELRIVKKSGQTVWVRAYAQPIWDEKEGRLTGICGAVKDITDKKIAEIAVRESEERLRTILDTEPECVKVLSSTGEIIDMNPAGVRILEADGLDQLVGRAATDILLPAYTKEFKDCVRRAMNGEAVEFAYEVTTLKGTRKWLEMHAVPLRSAAGEITSVLGVSRDVTEQRRAAEELRRSEQRFSDLINSVEGIVWEADVESFLFTFVSKQAETILGYPIADWLKEHFWEAHIHPDDREWAVNFCVGATQKGEPHSFEYRMIASDGRTVWLRDIVTVVVEDGRPTTLRGLMVDITEQRRKDAAIQRQAMLIEQANEAIFVWDLESGIIEWNKGCEKLYGYSRDEVLGKFGFDILSSKVPMERDEFFAHLKEKGFWSGEITQITKAGTTVYSDTTYQLIEFEGRKIVLQTNRDMTQSRLAEKALRQSEERYRLLFESSPYPMWVYDVETLKFLAVNSASIYHYGYTREEFLSMSTIDIRPEEEVPRFLEQARSTVSELDSSTGWKHRKKDGSVITVEITSHSLRWEGKSARLVLAHDISDRLKAEQALRRSEAKYRELFENANDVIYTHDLEGNFTSLNGAGEVVTGYTEAEALTMNISQVVVPEFLERARQMILRKVEGSPPTIYETQIIAKNGRRVPLEINTRLIVEGGQPIGVQGIGRDISERLAAQEALRQSEEQLRQSQKLEAIGILAGGMAHDFNNMLTAINGYSDLILRKISEDDPIRKNVEEIRKAGERSADLTRQLLAFSRRQIMQPMVVDLNDTVEETTSLLRRLIGEDITIDKNLSADLWRIEADPGQLAQVLMNLTINSRDAMPDGGTLLIETSNVVLDKDYASRHMAVAPGRYVMLAVSDTGVGMDEETTRRVFEPFFTTKSVGRGTGLGLSTVYGIVKQSGGNIWVYSEVGKGSTFKIYLPEANSETKTEFLEESQRELQIGSETILLVEDEPAVRGLAREILEACGYTVLEAFDGLNALEKFEGCSSVDLLVTDVVMPRMGGRELSEKLLSRCPSMKVLFTSGYTDDAILRHGITDEGTNFLQKPFTFDALSKKVRSLLDSE